MNKKLIKNLALIIIPILIIAGVGITLQNIGVISTNPLEKSSDVIKATLIIDYGNNNNYTYVIEISNATVYNLLIHASEKYDFTVEAEYHPQYRSHYIQSINSVSEENGKYWQYYVNGAYGTLGADIQPVKDNDIIEWKLQEPKI